MKGAYPELEESANRIAEVVEAEEHQFARVVAEGSRRFDIAVADLIRPYVNENESLLMQLQSAALR